MTSYGYLLEIQKGDIQAAIYMKKPIDLLMEKRQTKYGKAGDECFRRCLCGLPTETLLSSTYER